ncbi:MAG: hypothetical protein OEZ02_12835, partial [Anaerolineae bacterium]|nr:hypothetical protein [Anaerolineae bacterium]
MTNNRIFKRAVQITIVMLLLMVISMTPAGPAQATESEAPLGVVSNGGWQLLTGGGVSSTSYNVKVNAMAFDGTGVLYAGGTFGVAGGTYGTYARNIAKWGGSAWSALGSGVDNEVFAMVVDSSNNLYVGGSFTSAGGITVNHVAIWNGSEWSALGTGIEGGSVRDLALDDFGNLYAGGSFTTAGGIEVNNIAMWDGNVWSALGGGMDNSVMALEIDSDGVLYAGGYFSNADGNSANGIAKWNGSSWASLGGSLSSYGNVRSLAFDGNGNLYAGGAFTSVGGILAENIAFWDGLSWSALGTGVYVNGYIEALEIDGNGNVYAGGGFTYIGELTANRIAYWDGSNWNPLGGGTNWDVFDIEIGNQGYIYVGGKFTMIEDYFAKRIARWVFCEESILSHLGSGSDPNPSPLKSSKCTGDSFFLPGENISLTAAPSVGWVVDSWAGTDDDGSVLLTNAFTMPENSHTVSVTYVEDPTCYQLTLTNTGPGAILEAAPDKSVGCELGYYLSYEPISLTASPGDGARVQGWSGTDNDVSHLTTNTLTMPPNAYAVSVTYATCYTLSKAHTGKGFDPEPVPLNSPGCASEGTFASGEVVSFTAAPDPGWGVKDWIGTDDDASTLSTNTLVMPASDHTVTVNYQLICYKLDRKKNGKGRRPVPSLRKSEGCTIDDTYVPGEIIKVTAKPAFGWVMKSWYGTVKNASRLKTNKVIMPAWSTIVIAKYKCGGSFYTDFSKLYGCWKQYKGTWRTWSGNYETDGVNDKYASTSHRAIYKDFDYSARMKRTGTCPGCANKLIVRGTPESFDSYGGW